MEKLYFTFGSDPAYPYGREDYVLVLGEDMKDCIAAFKGRHPNRAGSECLNCADYYRQQEADQLLGDIYKGKDHVETIISEKAYGSKPKGFEPIWFIVPSRNVAVFLQEGSGNALGQDDMLAGYVDYLDCTVFEFGHGEIEECGGGTSLLKEYVQDKYGCLADAIPDILEFLYDEPYLDARILEMGGK